MNFLTATQAAEKLGVKVQWVKYLCGKGRIRATKLGNAWMIKEKDAVMPKALKVGRQRKTVKENK